MMKYRAKDPGSDKVRSSTDDAKQFLERLARTYPHLSENGGEDDLLRLHTGKPGKP
jgi:hypothetical protein